jgi:hypothetical protein
VVEGQLIPAGVLVTLPAPSPASVTVSANDPESALAAPAPSARHAHPTSPTASNNLHVVPQPLLIESSPLHAMIR